MSDNQTFVQQSLEGNAAGAADTFTQIMMQKISSRIDELRPTVSANILDINSDSETAASEPQE